MAEIGVNEFLATLAGSLNDNETEITLSEAPPAAAALGTWRMRIGPLPTSSELEPDYELVIVDGTLTVGAVVTVTRGAEGTAAVAWSDETPVSSTQTAGSLAAMIAEASPDHSVRHEDGGADEISVLGLTGGLPAGGTEGQALIKQSGTDGDAGWRARFAGTAETPAQLEPVEYAFFGIQYDTEYDDGVDGVGATLSADDADEILDADGNLPTLGQRLLVQHEEDSSGVYVVTEPGDGVSIPWVLTRATDCDAPERRSTFWVVAIIGGTLFAGGSGRVTTPEGGIGLALAALGASAEGRGWASGPGSHAEGNGVASGVNAHAEGEGIASGDGSHAEGSGIATGQRSRATGSVTTAGGAMSIAEGQDTVAWGHGQYAHCSGHHSYNAQYDRFTYSNPTSDDTPTVLTHGSGGHLEFPDYGGTFMVEVHVVARQDFPATGVDSGWIAKGVIRGDGVSAYSWVGGTPPTFTVVAQDAGAATWSPELSIDDLELLVTVTGEAATTILWLAVLHMDEIS